MTKFQDDHAVELIKAGLVSGSIKLTGANSAIAYSKTAAEADAAYLLTMLAKLTSGAPTS